MKLEHTPVNPPRDRHLGEHSFYDTWRAGAGIVTDADEFSDGSTPLEDIVGSFLGPPTQRDATICASLAVWLGTNCGSCVVHEARRYAEKGLTLVQGFLLVWAEYNHRKSWLNSGHRTIDYVLAGPECYREATVLDFSPLGSPIMHKPPELTGRDVEIC